MDNTPTCTQTSFTGCSFDNRVFRIHMGSGESREIFFTLILVLGLLPQNQTTINNSPEAKMTSTYRLRLLPSAIATLHMGALMGNGHQHYQCSGRKSKRQG